jgi:hypothetical protein
VILDPLNCCNFFSLSQSMFVQAIFIESFTEIDNQLNWVLTEKFH